MISHKTRSHIFDCGELSKEGWRSGRKDPLINFGPNVAFANTSTLQRISATEHFFQKTLYHFCFNNQRFFLPSESRGWGIWSGKLSSQFQTAAAVSDLTHCAVCRFILTICNEIINGFNISAPYLMIPFAKLWTDSLSRHYHCYCTWHWANVKANNHIQTITTTICISRFIQRYYQTKYQTLADVYDFIKTWQLARTTIVPFRSRATKSICELRIRNYCVQLTSAPLT